MLVLDLNCPVVNEENKEERKKILLDYFTENLNRHNFYAFRFFICEALNFINVFVQIYFMDYFLGGEFSTYGSDVLSFTEMEPEERGDPMSRVFPKVTKCTFHKYGPSGSVQKFDGKLESIVVVLMSNSEVKIRLQLKLKLSQVRCLLYKFGIGWIKVVQRSSCSSVVSDL